MGVTLGEKLSQRPRYLPGEQDHPRVVTAPLSWEPCSPLSGIQGFLSVVPEGCRIPVPLCGQG